MRLAALVFTALIAAFPAQAKSPVLVELFTSQGCQACLEANGRIAELADGEDVLPLTFTVDYWDYLGWRDSFAKSAFGERHKLYVKRLAGGRGVISPQIVVDGRAQVGRSRSLEALVREAERGRRAGPALRFGEHRVSVGSGPAPKGGAEVWLVRYDPRVKAVEVDKGQNRGRTVTLRNVVEDLVRLGSWTGAARSYRLPKGGEGLRQALIVQQAGGGRVIAVGVE